MSKNQFCKMIIKNAEKGLGRTAIEADILSSSCLAVAMEHLGLIKDPQLKWYASERGGIVHSYHDFDNAEFSMLSAREILAFLPDEVDKEQYA